MAHKKVRLPLSKRHTPESQQIRKIGSGDVANSQHKDFQTPKLRQLNGDVVKINSDQQKTRLKALKALSGWFPRDIAGLEAL